MTLKKLIEAKRRQLGEGFQPSCLSHGLTERDIEDALSNIIRKEKEISFAQFLGIDIAELIKLAQQNNRLN